jgi:glucose-1-phosphate adenylyltransferase
VVEEGAVVKDSIIMKSTTIRKNAFVDKAIIAENCEVGEGAQIGVGEEAESKLNASIYSFGLATIGDGSVIPAGVTVGKNTAIRGVTTLEDYPNKELESGGYIIKAGEEA